MFRGKNIGLDKWLNYGEWCCGFFAGTNPVNDSKSYIICRGIEREVATNTVGQFTGLKDRNGVEIYEGDIIEYQVMFYGKERTKKMIVEWKEDCETDLLCEPTFSGYLWSGYDYEIIGNIYDNPELLNK